VARHTSFGSNPVEQECQQGFRRGATLAEKLAEREFVHAHVPRSVPFVPHEQALFVSVKDQLPRVFVGRGWSPCAAVKLAFQDRHGWSPFMRSGKYQVHGGRVDGAIPSRADYHPAKQQQRGLCPEFTSRVRN
jgi:hypothetical protein